jgi:lysophospholipase L1-like esterase
MNISETLSALQNNFLAGIADPRNVLLWAGTAIGIYLAYQLVRVLIAFAILLTRKLFLPHVKPVVELRDSGEGGILIAGDSTGVGTGAKRPEETIAGRLAKEYPRTSIINISENGAITHDLMHQLAKAPSRTYDMIILSTGGNDIWRFTDLVTLGEDLAAALAKATEMSNHRVLLLFYGNMGLAPIFPALFRNVFTRQTYKVRAVFQSVADAYQVPIIELFTAEDRNPFQENPRTYYAVDMIHPSNKGYEMWYNRMWRIMSTQGYHFRENLPSLDM